MVTSYEAARAVRLRKDWRDRYEKRAYEVLGAPRSDGEFTVRIVGRAGVGKGSLVNYLLRRPTATVSHNVIGNDSVERTYRFGRFKLLDVPGYDGQHANASRFKKGSSSDKKPEGSLSLENFVEAYRLSGKETNALIFVVNNRITTHDKELMALAVESRKFFCLVRTYADSTARITDHRLQMERAAEMEQEIRNELSLTKDLNIRIFKVCIPWPESRNMGSELQGTDLSFVDENSKLLDFPLLTAYLHEPKGLFEELQIFSFVQEEIAKALEPFSNVRTRDIVLNFSAHAVFDILIPVVGPVVLTLVHTMIHTIRALAAVGLVEEPEKAVDELVGQAKKTKIAGAAATKGGLVAAFEDTLIHIFGKVVVEIAIYDLAVAASEATLSKSIPLVGAFVSAGQLSTRFNTISGTIAEKACMLLQLWIMQNVTRILDSRRLR